MREEKIKNMKEGEKKEVGRNWMEEKRGRNGAKG